jgi:uncharacterized protein (TIGR02996 family)
MTVLDDGFFHTFQQDPDDDAPRLIYADQLDDRGDDPSAARAELIRVQVELARLSPLSPRAAELIERQDELLEWGERLWLGEWADVLAGWTFRRGLVEAVRVDASVFLDRAADLFAAFPTLTVAKLTRAAGHLPELAACPWLAHLRGLDLSDNDITGPEIGCLTASRNTCLLEALDLSDNPLGPGGAERVGNPLYADELRELHLARCGLGGEGLARLLGGYAPAWRRLDLSGNHLTRRDAVRLAESRVMGRVASLDLADNPLDDGGVSGLVSAPAAAGLVDLGLCATDLGDRGLAAVAESPHLPDLRSLDVRGHHSSLRWDPTGYELGGLADLARSPLLGRLRRLLANGSDGRGNGWTADVLAFARPPRRVVAGGGRWITDRLRKSPYLVPSLLVECDLADLWWLGDPQNRERVPGW